MVVNKCIYFNSPIFEDVFDIEFEKKSPNVIVTYRCNVIISYENSNDRFGFIYGLFLFEVRFIVWYSIGWKTISQTQWWSCFLWGVKRCSYSSLLQRSNVFFSSHFVRAITNRLPPSFRCSFFCNSWLLRG